jgi:hypothetical protein
LLKSKGELLERVADRAHAHVLAAGLGDTGAPVMMGAAQPAVIVTPTPAPAGRASTTAMN